MTKNKNYLLIAGAILVGALVVLKITEPKEQGIPLVAITQFIEHSSLDTERESIIQTLEANGFIDGKTVKVVYQNAQGNVSISSQIANQLVSQKPAVIVAISTPSAQAAIAATNMKNIPVVFTAVTDPVGSRVLDSTQTPGEWITGVSDRLGTEEQLHFIRQIHPDIKRLGVIYNPGEINSTATIAEIKMICQRDGLELVEATASKTSDVAAATQSLIGKVDVVYIPNDNTAVSAMKSITGVAEKNSVPVYAGDIGSVQNGAIATLGYDRKELGQKAGQMVVDVLHGKAVNTITPATKHELTLYVNERALKQYGINLPENLRSIAHMVGDAQ
jgi:putative ABC transport system substrate-binding protein